MILITGKNYENVLESKNEEKILFPEYGKNSEELKAFAFSLRGDEIIVTASLELIDLLLERFKRHEGVLIYSDTGESLTFKEAYELRKYLDFDLRGGDFRDEERANVIFCEGKTDSKFFKATYKKLFGFKEVKKVPETLKLIERVFERENYELIKEGGVYLAIIPSEGNSGVIRNLGNFLRAMEVFRFKVNKIGIALDIDESEEVVFQSIRGKLSGFDYQSLGNRFKVEETLIVPLLIGYHVNHGCIDWKKPTVEDLMIELLSRERVIRKIERAINILCIDLKRKLKPKEVIYLAMAAKGFWGNLEGFYEMMIMRSRRRNLESLLRRAKLYDDLAFLGR
ncbi:hypothetical protein PAP_05405 [Palaeococcus pacificus DY20341]|uniref:Uncharacterized protein n=1 Tax=Palaeococcus pacificus DY20341 TaxID=1343739 RepID=A0A075LT41_9EURY|nr:DUF3226 domain-containing protein [Palaeococcus pacificus]AIF69484.1 hypothetical protein PAP_05405 [Palaeococcus pacificus DY20341]